ncbi:MAG: hypothetical protein GC145_02365 [Caulobacter sp.]|nr:hypothetical protein [Caulobacter sp.]
MEVFLVPGIKVLGEQDGPLEKELKTALTEVFVGQPKIRAAYLVRIERQDSGERSVALIIQAEQDEALMVLIGGVVHDTLGRDQYLDVIFATPQIAAAATKAADPFYRAS